MAYNGWKNYETWNVALWIDNEQHTYRLRQSWAQEAWDEAQADRTFTREERATLDLSDKIKEYLDENNPLGDEASTYSDLLSAALGEVDCYEIAEHWIEDVDREEEEGEEDLAHGE
jgi:hypothetical protein